MNANAQSDPQIESLRTQVLAAIEKATPLTIRGGGSKHFYGPPGTGEALDVRSHTGVIDYAPSELVISARCGTPLANVEALLAEHGQMLGFEPPHFGPHATLGGCVATGLSGPRRASAGSVRDFMLGARLLDGRGQVLGFGGRVMKNVAGYDVSRVLAGSLGMLGVILDVSLKVLPQPAASLTLRFELAEETALHTLNRWGGQPLPISASCWHDGQLWVRLAGATAAVAAAHRQLGGDALDTADAERLWQDVREHRHDFFTRAANAGLPLWRLSVPATRPLLLLSGTQLIEWGGALRWWATSAPPAEVRAAARGGHATLFRANTDPSDTQRAAINVFQTPDATALAIQHRLKQEFDPHGVFNPHLAFNAS